MVIIILGSKSDMDWGEKIGSHLAGFGLKYRILTASAHKTPLYLLKLLSRYEKEENGHVYICVAGRSNALGGFVDAQVKSPVINCPPPSEKYAGLDILSSLRMPSGVACLTVLEADQAALAAAKIFALGDEKIAQKITKFQKKMKEAVIND